MGGIRITDTHMSSPDIPDTATATGAGWGPSRAGRGHLGEVGYRPTMAGPRRAWPHMPAGPAPGWSR